jgi:hypothetical protein
MKSYEILPADMIGSAMKGGGDVKEPKPHEILPEAGTAARGLVGWTKGAASIAQGVPTPEVFSKQAIGLPYAPAGTVVTQGGATIARTGKIYEILPAGMTGRAQESKPYEIVPGAGVMGRGLGSKPAAQGLGGCSGGCGCGGKCGGGTGHDHHPSGMKKSGGCGCGGKCGGTGKAGGCGCGGKCGGTGGGALLPPSTGTTILPPSTDIRLPRSLKSYELPTDGSHLQSSIGWPGNLSPGGAGGEFFSSPPSRMAPSSCTELQAKIDELVRRINWLETAPPLPPGACGDCPQGMNPQGVNCRYPCDAVHDLGAVTQCACTRISLGLDGGRSIGASGIQCPWVDRPPQEQRDIHRNYQDLCDRGRVVSQLLAELRRLLEEQARRGCGPGPNPPPPPGWCLRHPRDCRRLPYCIENPLAPECQPPPPPPPQPPPRPPVLDCDLTPHDYRCPFDCRQKRFWSDPRCPLDCRRNWSDPRCPPNCQQHPDDPRCNDGSEWCRSRLAEFDRRRQTYEDTLEYYDALALVLSDLSRPAPSLPTGCDFSPACAALESHSASLTARLASIPDIDATVGSDFPARARAAVQRAIDGFGTGAIAQLCGIAALDLFGRFRCRMDFNEVVLGRARPFVWGILTEIYSILLEAANYANRYLVAERDEMVRRGCRVPALLDTPSLPRRP